MGRRYQNPRTNATRRSRPPTRAPDRSSVTSRRSWLRPTPRRSTSRPSSASSRQAGAYPAKRFLLESPPVVLAALHDLGVDLVTLGNNHAYDWQEPWGGLDDRRTRRRRNRVGGRGDDGGAGAGRSDHRRRRHQGRLRLGDHRQRRLRQRQPARCRRGQAGRRSTTRRVAVRGTNMFGFGKPGDPAYIAHANRAAPGVAWTDVRPSSSRCSTPIRQEHCGRRWPRSIPSCRTGSRGAATVALHRSRSAVRSRRRSRSSAQRGRRTGDRRDPRRLPVLRRRQ